ncbi:MAG: ribonuclease [Fulvimarina manganoxydans]|uniref:ribonuclease T2 family protein n=1 Tax=Fulvimarina manganoxydans TaxID=937218 RepID=UPI0023577712|nr:ribonuclease [Fulvimarina manganoxydans]MCK5933999.1 ribonuclease [Fulvimarina manganoxydans]
MPSCPTRAVMAALATLVLAGFAPITAKAQTPMSGTFIAEARCPALQSIRRKSNPGTVTTEPGASYELVGRNTDPATHYYVVFPGAEPERRWIAVGCGRIATPADLSAEAKPREPASNNPRGSTALGAALARATARTGGDPAQTGQASDSDRSPHGRYVLAASWHAAFCEGQPRRRECRSGGQDEAFTLHGLWVEPRDRAYCGVPSGIRQRDEAGRWSDLPAPDLTPDTARALDAAMPGRMAALDRHEWVKHGSCYGADAEEYFRDSLALLSALNASPVRDLFRDRRGKELASTQIRRAFDEAFGRGAGARVLTDCKDDDGRRIIAELRIHLEGTIAPDSDLGALMRQAPKAAPGCRGGIVDPSGDQ